MKIIDTLRGGWNEIPNSVKFWNGLVLLILIGVGIYSMEVLGVIWAFGSLLALAVLIEGVDTEEHLWMYFMPLMWFLFVLALVISLGVLIHHKTVVPFNEWLDKNKGDEE
jgi:hypothetical protein